MTHQEIADAISAVESNVFEQITRVRIDQELMLKPLRRKCGERGHIFQSNQAGPYRRCVVCGEVEIKAT